MWFIKFLLDEIILYVFRSEVYFTFYIFCFPVLTDVSSYSPRWLYWSPTNAQEYLSLNDVSIILADVTDVYLLPNKVRLVILSLTVFNTFLSWVLTACRWKFAFYVHIRKAILSYITLDVCFPCRRLLPSVSKLSILQPLFGISSQALTMTPIKLQIIIKLYLFDKCLPLSH